MDQKIKILHLEDMRSDAELVERELNKSGLNFERLWVTNKKDFKQALKDFMPDVILSDHSLPGFTSVQAFDIAKEAGAETPFILITATISEDFAVNRIKAGVADYLLKDRPERLGIAIKNALEKHKAEAERQRFLAQVIENENLLRKTEKLARMGSWKHELPTNKLHWSEELYYMYGYNPDEVTPQMELVIKHVHPDDREMFKKVSDEAIQNRANSKMTFRIIDKAGITKWMYCELGIELGNNGQPQYIQGFNQDITERKKAEIAIKDLNENLEKHVQERTAELSEANKALEAFSSTVSHDLRAPVRAILGFTKIIQKEYGTQMEPDIKELFGFIEENGNRMNAIINDLLKLAKYGDAKLKPEPVNMAKLINGVWLNISRTTIHHAVIELGELPDVMVDISMVQQVIVNLLSNAIKYSSKVEKPVLKVWCEQTATHNTFYFKDNGAGFDMTNYDRLFGAFQRFHTSREFEGTGVGLTLVKRIIEKHGGTVGADAKVDEGATFYFTLPVL